MKFGMLELHKGPRDRPPVYDGAIIVNYVPPDKSADQTIGAREDGKESREYVTGAAMGAAAIWATPGLDGAGDRLAKAKSESAAPTLATRAARIGRVG